MIVTRQVFIHVCNDLLGLLNGYTLKLDYDRLSFFLVSNENN